ncbi:MAG TPA: ABC transporter permease [Candidatus Limnocylindrales bacterium]|nr:ABC transporter permease [Candidatus Limnocylindrales bacterium]
MDQPLDSLLVLIGATLRIATPILVAALGETIIERAGVLNLGIEGTLLLSSFTGFVAAQFTGSLWLGLLVAVLTGVILCLLMGLLGVTFGLNQHVSGLGITLLATALALFWFRLQFGGASTPPALTESFQPFALFTGTPLEPVFSQHWLTVLALLLVPITSWMLYRTSFGLRVRAVGENPEAADTAGVSVYRVRYQALILGGMLMGLGGAFLSLAQLGAFSHGIINGRGWVAIAIVIFGNWKPSRVLAGALLFSFVQALQLRLQVTGIQLPYELLLALPYVLTIVAIALVGRNVSVPAALLKSYRREG